MVQGLVGLYVSFGAGGWAGRVTETDLSNSKNN